MDTANSDRLVFGLGEEIQRCSRTGRAYEKGSGALSHAEQTANFVREAARAADMPKDSDRCEITGRFFECGSGALTKTQQSALFAREASPEQAHHDDERATALAAAAEVQRLAKIEADALASMVPSGATSH
jgi:hypothetical protein